MIDSFFSTLSTHGRVLVADPVRRFQLSLLAFGLLIISGTVGFQIIEGMSVDEAFYMTIITVTTVGFGEVQPLSPVGRLFTSGLILLGVGIATTAVSNAVSIVLGPWLWQAMRERKMEALVATIENHFIVCGYGRMGEQVVRDLQARNEAFVIVEADPQVGVQLLEENLPHVLGDATQDETLHEARIDRARGLVAALDSDADNVMTALSAREINRQLFIVARAENVQAERKLRRAGANRVLSPYNIGGHQMAVALLRPAVYDFMELLFSVSDDMEIGQVSIRDGSPLAGQTIGAGDLRRLHNVSILAVQDQDNKIAINPGTQHVISVGETLIVIGPSQAIFRIEVELDAHV